MKNRKISNTLGTIAITLVLAGFSSFIPSFAQEAVENQAIDNSELETTTDEDVQQEIEKEKGEADADTGNAFTKLKDNISSFFESFS